MNHDPMLGAELPRSHRVVSETQILAYEFTPSGTDRR